MARSNTLIIPNSPHHVSARGMTALFSSRLPEEIYAMQMNEVAEKEKVLLHGYCLLPDEVRWLATPTTPNGLSRLMARVHTSWSGQLNRAKQRVGRVFEGRYRCSVLSDDFFWFALRHIEQLPCRANLVTKPENFPYSSARAHSLRSVDGLVSLAPAVSGRSLSPRSWQNFLAKSDPEVEQYLTSALQGSRPCGPKEWISQFESVSGKSLQPRRPG